MKESETPIDDPLEARDAFGNSARRRRRLLQLKAALATDTTDRRSHNAPTRDERVQVELARVDSGCAASAARARLSERNCLPDCDCRLRARCQARPRALHPRRHALERPRLGLRRSWSVVGSLPASASRRPPQCRPAELEGRDDRQSLLCARPRSAADRPDDGEISQLWRYPTFPLLLLNDVRVPYFLRHLGSRDSSVLDVGCGGGLVTEDLAQAGYNVSAIDLSPRTIEFARQHAAEQGLKIDYHVGSAYALPFADASFDAVVSVRRGSLVRLTSAERRD